MPLSPEESTLGPSLVKFDAVIERHTLTLWPHTFPSCPHPSFNGIPCVVLSVSDTGAPHISLFSLLCLIIILYH